MQNHIIGKRKNKRIRYNKLSLKDNLSIIGGFLSIVLLPLILYYLLP